MKKIVSSVIFGLALISLVAPHQADALPTLQLSDGTTTITVADGGGSDLNAASGNVLFVGTIGLWTFTVSSGTTTPILGSTTSPHLNLLHGNAKSTGTGTLTVKFSETGFSSSPVAWVAAIAGSQAAGESAQYKTYFDAGNVVFGETTSLTDSGALVGSPFISTKVSGVFGDPSFSLTQKVTLSSVGATNTSFTANLQPVPEPASLLLLGSGLIGLSGFGFWRRKNTQA